MPGNTNDKSRLLTDNPDLIETDDTIININDNSHEQVESENIQQLLVYELKKMGKKDAFDLAMSLAGAVGAYTVTDLLHNERKIAQSTFKAAAAWRIFLGPLSMVPKSQNAEWWLAISKIILNLIYVAGTVEVNATASVYNGDVSLWAAEFPNKLPMGCFLTSAASGTVSALCETLRLSCVKDSKMYNFWQNLELFFGSVCTVGATIGAATLFDVKGLAAPLAGPIFALVDGVTGVYGSFNAICSKVWNRLTKKNGENVVSPTNTNKPTMSANTSVFTGDVSESTVPTSQLVVSSVVSDTFTEVSVIKEKTNQLKDEITTEQARATFNAAIINGESFSSDYLGVPSTSRQLKNDMSSIYTTNVTTSNFEADEVALHVDEVKSVLVAATSYSQDVEAKIHSIPTRSKGSFTS